MDDLVSRESALTTLARFGYTKNMRVNRAIQTLPAVDAALVVHGEWIDLGFNPDEPYGLICSICHTDVLATRHYPVSDIRYCPSCGAKMDGKTQCIHDNGDYCKVLSDAEVKQPCIEGPCPDHATLAEQQADLARKTAQLHEVMELLGLAVKSLESIADCETCKHFDDCSYDHEYRTAMAGNVRILCTDCFSWKHTDRLDALTKRER